ncbi:sulfite exporter TauE/SafE family protein [Acidithiobacillus sulfuriphilus]|uniref:Sulfite exporter TauE/SafE family protein n=2 Tax=Acidithiobacillus sulfuriphilus TaxID=1867749 RepID=A0ACD5HLD9_9PROT|nr:sulfite exporter TauE/SafE family protein [Acidithiobacillus sulfuriphilus]RNF68099.1 sulfite exporter TauE/SafE family protein [Acidithiobacillus sulfuriphilus]
MVLSPSLSLTALLEHPFLLLLATVIVFAAFYVRATIGFGSGLIAVAMLTLLFPIKEVVPVVLLLDLLGSVLLGAYDFHEIRWPELRWLVPGSFVGLAIGSFILAATDAQNLTRFLGVFILAYVVYALALKPEGLPRVSLPWGVPLGIFGGIVGSLYGGGGPPIVAYLQMRHLDKRAFRATFQGIALTDNVLRVFMYVGLSLLTVPLALGFLLLVPPLLLGLWAGNHLHMRINQRIFLYGTLLVLALVGCKYLL